MKYLKVKKLNKDARIDMPACKGDSGYDVYAIEDTLIMLGKREKIPLGLSLEFPEGYACIVNQKSGRASKEGLATIGNVIDSGYRGEIHVIAVNTSHNKHINIKKGEKIAQLLFHECHTPKIEFTSKLDDTKRGDKGFGSTGLKPKTDVKATQYSEDKTGLKPLGATKPQQATQDITAIKDELNVTSNVSK